MAETINKAESEKRYDYFFTVFTPTYNRAHSLPRVYTSLKNQTYRNFEWLIVDDGSSDNTGELVDQWQKEADFPIRYIYQKNSGKHMAYNLGAREAKGEFFVCLDSDDACTPEALEHFKYHWEGIPQEEQDKFVGIDCLCQDENGNVIGSYYPSNPTDANYLEIRYRLKVTGEKWGCQRTEVLKKFPFPEIRQPKLYVPENIVWSKMAKKYKIRSVNECMRIYYTNSGTDQITKEVIVVKNPVGFQLMYKSTLEQDIEYFKYKPLFFLRAASNYIRYSLHINKNLITQFIELESIPGRLLWFIALPIGFAIWVKDQMKKYFLR